MRGATFWRNLTSALVSASFIAANVGYGKALDLWNNGAEGILIFLGIGIGGKWLNDRIESYVNRKYGNRQENENGMD